MGTRMNRRIFLKRLGGVASSAVLPSVQAAGGGFAIAPASTQLVTGVADGWSSTTVRLQRWERKSGGPWQPVGVSWQGRLGGAGLIWGRGLHPTPPGAPLKREGDKRAPAGVFALGTACGYDRDIVRHPDQPYFQVTARDLWIEDPASPQYNTHVRLERAPRTPWEKKAQMRQGDYAHSLKLFIRHNAPPRVVAGGGSSIFFHIWRAGGSKASIGCTTMSEAKLRELIAWLNPRRLPVYVLLPQAEYDARRAAWGLP
jgi:L,D-peptidoglycan transpeptidase YkuD (ErfK/YbiS/YcfS/YnhG family)